MNIKKFAEKTSLTPRAIRFYEEKGILKSTRDSENQYRIFDQSQVAIAKKISHFRQLGFSIDDIARMLTTSPSLSIESVNKNIQANLKKLYTDKAATEKKIKQTEALLNATSEQESLSANQKELFQAMAYSNLQDWSLAYVESCLKRKSIGPDEELQMVACAYADLVLKHHQGVSYAVYAQAHKLIAKVLTKIKDEGLAQRHRKLSEAYENLHKDPNWLNL